MATDQFCLRWNNFQINITSVLESLKNDEDLVDVTLTCEGHNVKAHKVILSACSPYFRNIFKENPCQHPIVILKDVKYEDVTALLNFMYCGEVYITQERLAPFLRTAELLQVRGLTGAAYPFKDFKASSGQQLKLKPQQQPASRLKRNPVPCGQLQHVITPRSPSPIPCSSSFKRKTVTRSSLTSLLQKDLNIGVMPSDLIERTEKVTPDHIAEIDLLDRVISPSGDSLSQPTSSSCCVTCELPCALHSNNAAEHISTLHSAKISGDTSIQLALQLASKVESAAQVPPPLVSKRRKTLPRRVSANQIFESPGNISLNVSDSRKELSPDMFEVSNQIMPRKEVSVKMEKCDEDLDNPVGEEESFVVRTDDEGSESRQQTPESEDNLSMEREVAEEEKFTSSDSDMLTCSLSASAHGSSLTDGNLLVHGGTSGKITSLPHVPQCGTCPHCGQTYSNQSALKYHVRLMHTDLSNRHCCHLCPRSFALRDEFKEHMWSKHKQRC